MENITTFCHNGTIGDCWAALPAIRENYKKTGRRGLLYLVNGQKAEYYSTAVHPTTNESGEMVMLNEDMINMMIPLFKAQECIYDCKIWDNEKVNVDFNKMRETFVNMPYGCISRWQFYTWPDLACDLSEVWMTVPDTDIDYAKNKIIVTRSERYLNPFINYRFLKKYEKDILFVGTEIEYHIFRLRQKLNIERLEINNFLELAQALKQCRFHISNQTQAFQISTGLKIPRIVELCSMAPNVIPYGKNAYDFYAQEALEYYVELLLKETEKTQLSGFVPPKIDFNNLSVH